MKNNFRYLSKETRDAAAKSAKVDGFNVKKSSCTGQQLHPQFVEDFIGDEKYDTGFGNTVYKTYFPKLYCLEILQRSA